MRSGHATRTCNSLPRGMRGRQKEILTSQNEYNEIGQLVTKNLRNTDPVATPDANRQHKQIVDSPVQRLKSPITTLPSGNPLISY